MKRYAKRGLSMVAASVSALALVAAPAAVFATPQHGQNNNNMASAYEAHLNQLNNSGVNGKAHLKFQNQHGGEQLWVQLHANGTTPDQIHPVHIHGKDHPEVAVCPTNAEDANNDGFVSVIEGAATYGPIKLNLTSPQTPFGAPPTTALFTPFAGTAELTDFPMANNGGAIHLNQTYTFDNSEAARSALRSLTPLEDQHIVVHGGMAPASVDADAFGLLGLPVADPLSTVIYDPLLPIACGEISAQQHNNVHGNNQNGHGNNRHQNNNNQQVHALQHEQANNNQQVKHHNNQVSANSEHQNNNQVNSNNRHQNNNQQVEHQNDGQSNTNDGHQAAQQADAIVAAFEARLAVLVADYEQAHAAAKATFEAERSQHPAVARDQFIAATQRAHDLHVNQFYEARNQLVDQLNQIGQTELRDRIMHDAEQKRMHFSEQFEAMKREASSHMN